MKKLVIKCCWGWPMIPISLPALYPRAHEAWEALGGGLVKVEPGELKKSDIQFEIVFDIHARCGMLVKKDFFA